jgi:hypothetical protein
MAETMEDWGRYCWTCRAPGMWCHAIGQAVPDISKDQSAFRVFESVHVIPCHQTSSSWFSKGLGCLHRVGKCSCDALSSDKQFLIFQRIGVPAQCWEVFMWWCVISQAVPDISNDDGAVTVLVSVHVMMCHQTSSFWFFKGPWCCHSVGKCSFYDSVTSQETWIFTEGTV